MKYGEKEAVQGEVSDSLDSSFEMQAETVASKVQERVIALLLSSFCERLQDMKKPLLRT